MKIISLLTCCFFCLQVQAQLGFCNGSKGDPIFHETFGSASGMGEELDPGVTSYTFVTGRDPNDGEYTVSDMLGLTFGTWYSSLPETTISNGRALIVNADFTAGRFYRTEVSGLCENTTYEFSAFLINVHKSNTGVCAGGDIPINVRFEIWDETDTVLLKAGNTGDIPSRSAAEWEQYALTFSSEPGQDTVILKMFNNGEGGCGNDLAIDDIIFRSCGDLTTISSDKGGDGVYNVCEENTPESISLTAVPDNSVYEDHFFQWQRSDDGEDWQEINGENAATFEENSINSTSYFRVKVAEDAVNLASNECSSASEAFLVNVVKTPQPPGNDGDVQICSNEEFPALSVSVEEDESVDWYDSPTGGNLLAENTNTYQAESSGIYYAEARKKNGDCQPSPRTAVELTVFSAPEVSDESLQICPDSELLLNAGLPGMIYDWSSGETSQSIVVNSPGTYSVEITNAKGCTSVKNFTVEEVPNAQISEVISSEASVRIVPQFEGDFLYSVDGINFQTSAYFEYVEGGIYTAFIKDLADCKMDSREFPHIVVPKFITPNNDGYNDSFKLIGLDYFESSYIEIYDRYGKLLAAGKGANFNWRGRLNGRELPSNDYWYVIRISGFPDRKGSFSLIR